MTIINAEINFSLPCQTTLLTFYLDTERSTHRHDLFSFRSRVGRTESARVSSGS